MKKILSIAIVFQCIFLIIAGIDFYTQSTIPFVPKLMMSLLLVLDGFIYLVSLFIKKQFRLYKLFFTLFILVNIGLTFTDEVGVWDYIILGLNIIILVIYHIISGHKSD